MAANTVMIKIDTMEKETWDAILALADKSEELLALLDNSEENAGT